MKTAMQKLIYIGILLMIPNYIIVGTTSYISESTALSILSIVLSIISSIMMIITAIYALKNKMVQSIENNKENIILAIVLFISPINIFLINNAIQVTEALNLPENIVMSIVLGFMLITDLSILATFSTKEYFQETKKMKVYNLTKSVAERINKKMKDIREGKY